MTIEKTSTNRRVPAVLGALTLAAALQACSSTTVSTNAYAPPAPLSASASAAAVQVDRSSIASFRARDRAVNSRPQPSLFDYSTIYAARVDEGVSIPAFDYNRMDQRYLRQRVRYFGPEAPGTIVVDAKRKHLYLIEPEGMAIRYGIAVGKEGYGWTGNAIMQWSQTWPKWTPPKEMIERKPELAKWADGMEGSIKNPLGARAMYLFKNGKDTLYRIHGTDKPFSIGKAASSGCFRMINQDVIDLYSRVKRKAPVFVRTEVAPNLVQAAGGQSR